MANYQNLLNQIASVITANGNNEITGTILKNTLQSMVSVMGEYATFGGVATPTTNPGTPDGAVFYLASTAGTYTSFGGLVVDENELAVLIYDDGVWSKESVLLTGDTELAIASALVDLDSRIVDNIATTDTLGMVKIGDNMTITEEGAISPDFTDIDNQFSDILGFEETFDIASGWTTFGRFPLKAGVTYTATATLTEASSTYPLYLAVSFDGGTTQNISLSIPVNELTRTNTFTPDADIEGCFRCYTGLARTGVVIKIFTSDTLTGLVKSVSDMNDRLVTYDERENGQFMFGNQVNYGHLFLDVAYGQHPAIPSQSLFDVDAEARLGFKYIEANVQTTSDGVLIPIHGVAGKFGKEVTDLNGDFTYENTMINSVTYDWIKQNLIYDTKFDKHKTTIPTLEEFLQECKLHGMSVMMTYSTASYALAKKYFGDNFIAYNGNRDAGFQGIIMTYSSLTTIADIVARCQSVKPPYIHMLDATAENTFFDETGGETLAELAQAVHEQGCMLGIAGVYSTPTRLAKFFADGGDVNASGWTVNEFDNGNICNLRGDADFSDFTVTDGTASDGVLSLATNGKIASPAYNAVYLGKGFLRIRFSGEIKVLSFGHSKNTNATFTSDGSQTIWLSSFFLEQTPTFEIQAVSATEIYMITYSSSKC